jgi:DNA-binding response OmpR family regulator
MHTNSSKVLIVEDDASIRGLLALHLKEAGFTIVETGNGLSGLELAKTGEYDLLILDVMLPGCSGTDICKEIRRLGTPSRIIMLTERASELDKVLGLEIGADDYVTKPFSIREIVARARAQLRKDRSAVEEKRFETILVGSLAINVAAHTVQLDGVEVDLTSTEFELLHYLAKHAGRAFTRGQLLNAVWGYSADGYEATVNTHINRLRSKIERDPMTPEFIVTVRGVGYKCATSPN